MRRRGGRFGGRNDDAASLGAMAAIGSVSGINLGGGGGRAGMGMASSVGVICETTKLYQFHTAKASTRSRESAQKTVFFAISTPI